mgnify:CR=1 FL=1
MSKQLLQGHRIKKEVSNKNFGYQLSSIVLIILLIRLYLFKQLFIFDFFLIFLFISIALISYFKSNYIIPIKKLWLKMSLYIAKILNPIILFFIYLLCFIPIGLVYKIIKKNSLKTKIKKSMNSYWERPEDKKINFEEQF